MFHPECSALFKTIHAIWLDNFSKVISNYQPSFVRDAWSNCLWTGCALIKFEPRDGVTIDIGIRRNDDDGEVIPAMPKNIFNTLRACVERFEKTIRGPKQIFRKALCTKLAVNSNPIKPFVGDTDPDTQAYLDRHEDGLTNFYPDKLMKTNIGSNLGLLKVLRDYCEVRMLHVDNMQTEYHFLNCDVNIYARTLRVSMMLSIVFFFSFLAHRASNDIFEILFFLFLPLLEHVQEIIYFFVHLFV